MKFCSYFFYTSLSWHSTYVDTANYIWQPATILHLINQLYLQSGLGLDPLARSLLAFFDDIGYWGWWARYLGSGGGGRGIAARMAIQGWKIFYQNGMFWKSRLTYKARSKYIEQKKIFKIELVFHLPVPVLDLRSSKAHNEGLNGAGDGNGEIGEGLLFKSLELALNAADLGWPKRYLS